MKCPLILTLVCALLLPIAARADSPAPLVKSDAGLNLSLSRDVLLDVSPGGNAPAGAEGQARQVEPTANAASQARQRVELPYGAGYEARRTLSTRGMGRGRGR